MQLLNMIRRPEAVEPQKPGRHSTVGLVERLGRELTELKAAREKEVAGYQDALQRAAKEVQEGAKFRAWFHKADAGWRAADAEVQRLQRILDEQAPVPETAPQAAPADLEGSCFNEPDPPAPEREQDQLPPIALSLPRPETYDVADVTAETQPIQQVALDDTQPVDVRDLRAAMGLDATVVIPPIPDRPAVVDPITAEIEAAMNIPGPPPFASATSIPVAAVKNAVSNVEAVLSEAS